MGVFTNFINNLLRRIVTRGIDAYVKVGIIARKRKHKDGSISWDVEII